MNSKFDLGTKNIKVIAFLNMKTTHLAFFYDKILKKDTIPCQMMPNMSYCDVLF